MLTFVPDSKLYKPYKGFVALMVIFMFITPLAKTESLNTFAYSTSYSAELSEEKLLNNDSSLVLACAEDLLNKSLEDAVKNAEINAEFKSYIKEENGEAYISKIDVYGELSEEEEKKVLSIINGIAGGVEIEFIG